MILARLRAPYVLPIVRTSVRVGAVRVGEDVWVPIYMEVATASVAEHMAVPVGSVVQFAVQYGTKAKEDESDMLILRGRVDVAREPYSTDDLVYNVTFLDVAKSWDDMTPGIPMPTVGQMFVISPNHVMSVESLPGAVLPPPAPAAIVEKPAKAQPAAIWPYVAIGTGAVVAIVAAVLYWRT